MIIRRESKGTTLDGFRVVRGREGGRGGGRELERWGGREGGGREGGRARGGEGGREKGGRKGGDKKGGREKGRKEEGWREGRRKGGGERGRRRKGGREERQGGRKGGRGGWKEGGRRGRQEDTAHKPPLLKMFQISTHSPLPGPTSSLLKEAGPWWDPLLPLGITLEMAGRNMANGN